MALSSIIRRDPLRRAGALPPSTKEGSIAAQILQRTKASFEQAAEEPNLRLLNASLQALTEIFPDVQPEVFREMLTTFDEESRLEVVTTNIMKHETKWIHGRYRVPRNDGTGTQRELLPTEQTFRSRSYREAVQAALTQEFKGLRKSAILAVLAENNYSYSQSRPLLITMSSRSWSFSITNFFTRRKQQTALDHPLIEWRPLRGDKDAPLRPVLRPTKSHELNCELQDALIEPYLAKEKESQERRDFDIAVALNEEQAREVDAVYECQCCFTDVPFESMAPCDAREHALCFQCIRRTLKEALYGQGWLRSVNMEKGTLRCLALSATDGGCEGCIPTYLIRRAMEEDPVGHETLSKFEERLANDSLLKSGVDLIRCPFCLYAEADNTAQAATSPWKLKNFGWLGAFVAVIVHLCYITVIRQILRISILGSFFAVTFSYLSPKAQLPHVHLAAARVRVVRKRRGLKFLCGNPGCQRASCMVCAKEWRDIHTCYESERQALRVAMERAMDEAVKRTCPRCNVSFVKSSGCNKLKCPCGYQMCNVCRSEIGRESYAHFCQHFRATPGRPCEQCDRCDLYRMEDEEAVRQRAAEAAEREWIEQRSERNEASQMPAIIGGTSSVVKGRMGRMVTWESTLDWLVDHFVE